MWGGEGGGYGARQKLGAAGGDLEATPAAVAIVARGHEARARPRHAQRQRVEQELCEQQSTSVVEVYSTVIWQVAYRAELEADAGRCVRAHRQRPRTQHPP